VPLHLGWIEPAHILASILLNDAEVIVDRNISPGHSYYFHSFQALPWAFAAELAIEPDAWRVTADAEFEKIGNLVSVYSVTRHEA
jgi:hypothetical protein